jgi:hypothetical protein
MRSGMLATTTTTSATAGTVAQAAQVALTERNLSLPQAKVDIHLFSAMLRGGVAASSAERVVMEKLRQEIKPGGAARRNPKQRLIHYAEVLARHFVPRPIIREILADCEERNGVLLGEGEMEQLVTAAITAAGEPDEPRRQPVPLALELHSPLDGWRRHVILGAAGDDRHKTIRSLAGHLLAKGVDPFVTAALVIAWAWVRCEPPVPANEVLGIANWVAKRHAEGVA